MAPYVQIFLHVNTGFWSDHVHERLKQQVICSSNLFSCLFPESRPKEDKEKKCIEATLLTVLKSLCSTKISNETVRNFI